jgi:myxalamid-type polyketide synthase MxaE and MxaD
MSNYAAANAGLDALAQARRARGQQALSIQWGPWANIGLWEGAIAARNGAELERSGVGALSAEQGAALFAAVIGRPEPVIAVLPIDWSAFRRARPGRDWPLFRAVSQAGVGVDAAPSTGEFTERHRAASPTARRALIESVIRDVLGAVIRRPASQLDSRRSFGSMGLDSLMALEFRNRLETAIERPLPATLAWNYPTIEQLTQHLDAQLAPGSDAGLAPDTAVNTISDDPDLSRLLDSVTSLSDAAAARVLRGEG